MKGSQFRWLNEQLYTTSGDKAMDMFTEDPSLFNAYHEGFRSQVEEWPENPVDSIIRILQGDAYRNAVIADMGCGDAKLAHTLMRQNGGKQGKNGKNSTNSNSNGSTHTVHSFDLVSVDPLVTACDVAHVPLANHTCDVVVFSLALMGTNYVDFLIEARRILKPKGTLIIAEVKSRIPDLALFKKLLTKESFAVKREDTHNKMFVMLIAKKLADTRSKEASDPGDPQKILLPCLYKRR
eukprot:comp21220_c0_seq1/m.45234 comp21220_c0_seq1/g.45234  ORF comp21220_c0_seq1/g.45234 comp21220_c0_seq1/m.45234 type:complete len:238 (+) comp21220_c0_seq1:1740-2453(+)